MTDTPERANVSAYLPSVLSTYAGSGTRRLAQRTRLERHHWDYTSGNGRRGAACEVDVTTAG